MAYDTNLIQKIVVHDGAEASGLMPIHAALVNEEGEPYGGAQGAQGPKGDKGDKGDAGATGAQGPAGAAGVGVKSISLTVTEGAVTAGTWTDTNDEPHSITISPAGA